MVVASAQFKDGYWDNIRTTNETVTLRAGEKKVVKSADFPEGTTEIVYRITLLDDNQKLSSSLVSVLKPFLTQLESAKELLEPFFVINHFW